MEGKGMNLRDKIIEWHDTKSIATAYDICEELYEEVQETELELN